MWACLLTLEIAAHFKQSPVTIGEAMIKVEDVLRKDQSFGKMLKRIGKNLVNAKNRKHRIPIVWSFSSFTQR
jgi:hypothetical protein